MIRPEDRPLLEPWAHAWYHEVVRQLVQSYTETIRPVSLLPSSPEAAHRLLELLVLEKALEEVDAELTGRIDWVVIPLQAVLRLLGASIRSRSGRRRELMARHCRLSRIAQAPARNPPRGPRGLPDRPRGGSGPG